MTHFGGGSRRQSAWKKRRLIQGMKPFFKEGLYLNSSIGFGYKNSIFYYYVVDEKSMAMTIFEMQDADTGFWTPEGKAQLAHQFKSSYELFYPYTSGSNGGKYFSPPVTGSSSIYRRGNATDTKPWTNHCHAMAKVPIVHALKSRDNSALLL